jgi:CHAT domain-containing protein
MAGAMFAGRHRLWRAASVAEWLLLFPLLLSLSDVRSVPPAVTYDHAQQSFTHGYLAESQEEADEGYARFLLSNPQWARRFQLLDAEAMARRGLSQDLLRLLADDRIPWTSAEDRVEKLSLEAIALINLHRLTEASQRLAEADGLCAAVCTGYASLLRAHGLLLIERDAMAEAAQAITASLHVAHASGDGLLESSLLITLGYIASQQEHHDEAREFYRSSIQEAKSLDARDIEQRALANEGWEQYQLGNSEKALELLNQADQQAIALGNKGSEVDWLVAEALIYASIGNLDIAEKTDLQAIALARELSKKQKIIDASMDLAQDYVDSGKPDESDRYSNQALTMARETGSELDLLNVKLIQGQAAALRHDWPRADMLLHEVIAGAGSQDSMRWDAQRSLGNVYEAQGDATRADQAYRDALALVEGARAAIQKEESRLAFLSKATRIYDDYIHFLVAKGRTEEALEAADWSRARTLQQGLGLIPSGASTVRPSFRALEIARRANATLLFYWLGERQSYLWAVSPREMTLIPLPAKREIVPRMERYGRALLDLKDPLKDGNRDGRALYDTLVAPAAKMIPPGGRVVLFADGEMSELNFETLVVGDATPHYWIENATILSAPSIRMFAAARPEANRPDQERKDAKGQGKLLLLGDSVSPGPEFAPLPMASVEVRKIQPQFAAAGATVFTREQATPAAYLKSNPEQFTYIHFVSHGTASRLDPLDSAVILSPDGGSASGGADSYKLRARDILRHPINARLVTISACDSSGAKAVAGEGLVGVSWAFLRAGAHNAIGALWDVSDASTPELMDRMYSGLEQGASPADALRDAKLSLVHGGGKFAKPFYWAPFQLYAGR